MNEVFIESTDVMTGHTNQNRYLYYQLKMSMRKASRIDIIVSFLMESGVQMILEDLKDAISRGVEVRILTGNYLGITQPSALCLIKKELKNQVDLRFYKDKGRSFHPKSYMFYHEKESEIYIGSSNVSRSALTSGVEWNYRFTDKADPKNFSMFQETFLDLFEHHSVVIDDEELQRYSKSWKSPSVARDLSQYDEVDPESETYKVSKLYRPRGAQIEALYALENSRAEGARRGLIHAATGIGKTYLAAFDSEPYERVLFVAHREEILKQAAESFYHVRKSEDYGFFDGNNKVYDKSVIFASVASLGKAEYLEEGYLAKDYFDYIVIDEFHHAVTNQYQRIVNYFEPKFLLGLTATPERMDDRNIYEICDYNVPYEISLKEAIEKSMLVPFRYYGIYDEVDYSKVKFSNGTYDTEELNTVYIGNIRRYDMIYKHYRKHQSKRALGFCCSKAHAEAMAREFCNRGIKAVAVYSNANSPYAEDRSVAIAKLEHKEIQVIFSVDMFNEGVDIASVDMVMFLRPTQSPIVFLQQLGRGLRTSKQKEYLTVLDFIGNYEKAGNIRNLLKGTNNRNLELQQGKSTAESPYPDGCLVDFDMNVIDLFAELEKKTLSRKQMIQNEYYRIKDLLQGQVPTRMELFSYMGFEVYEYCMKTSKENPFRNYLKFLADMGELKVEEQSLRNSIGFDFLQLIEQTNMQKVYKMPILFAFYNHGNPQMAVTEEEVLMAWREFFDRGTNWKDFADGITKEQYQAMTDKEHIKKAKTMPIKFLKESGNGFFVDKEGYALALSGELIDIIGQKTFINHMKDILEYRTMEYYRRRYDSLSKDCNRV